MTGILAQTIRTMLKGQHKAALCFLLVGLTLTACGGQPKTPPKGSAADIPTVDLPQIAKAPAYGPLENMDEEPQPVQLEGMTAAELSDLLGDPNLRRIDPPAQLWQYRGKRCVLLVFLYDLEKTGHFKVHHLQARSREKGAEGICIPSLIAQKKS